MMLGEHVSKFQPRHPPHPGAPRAHAHWLLLLQVSPLAVLHAVQAPPVPQAALVPGQVHVWVDEEQIAPFVQAVQELPQALSVYGQEQTPPMQVFGEAQ